MKTLPRLKYAARALLHALALLSVKFLTLTFLFLLCLYALFQLVHEVFSEGDTGFDTRMFDIAQSLSSPGMTHFMRHVSFFGSDEYLIVAMALSVLVLSFYRSMQWNSLRMLLISFTVSVLNTFLKHYFVRPRPELGLLVVPGLSFPSGHAMIGGVFYGVLGYIIWTTVSRKVWRWVLISLLTLFVLLIGFSRVYLRVHYATDVAAGYLFGILWLMLSLYLMSRLERFYVKRYKKYLGSYRLKPIQK
ncbi:phosphatase PAP2 family protein [Pontibacter mangrovi]|uniref:Phosphatase PAP2 family protein n=1 Tax=Pontibacter mangrovi TaxID=2589816 RepID=A0A501WD24_9BACT|nr:phosphatase PAP2 family protein [Pontibacter mangrovi]TPE43386.1 phosphatase PAP2 family protein [Pontibacter mangrovi]